MSQAVLIQQLQEENARLKAAPSTVEAILNNPSIRQALFERLVKQAQY